jgi:fimbrial chaperone protein
MTLAAASAAASTFSIAPVRIELSQVKRTEVLTVRNEENSPVVLQATVHTWSQSNGQDQLTDTRDILSTPPVFTLTAKSEQIIRVAMRNAIDSKQERSYRLILQEVLPDAPPGFTGLRVALKMSLPIFIAPANTTRSVVAWQARRTDATHVEIAAQNDGDAHLQVTDFTLESPGASPLRQSTSRYVLPGSRITWSLPANEFDGSAPTLKLHAFTDQGEISQEIPFDGN